MIATQEPQLEQQREVPKEEPQAFGRSTSDLQAERPVHRTRLPAWSSLEFNCHPLSGLAHAGVIRWSHVPVRDKETKKLKTINPTNEATLCLTGGRSYVKKRGRTHLVTIRWFNSVLSRFSCFSAAGAPEVRCHTGPITVANRPI